MIIQHRVHGWFALWLFASLVLITGAAAAETEPIATLSDTSGTTISFTTFEVKIENWGATLQYQGGLDDIYSNARMIPIAQKSGATLFIPMNLISQYDAAGDGTFTLSNGNHIEGALLPEAAVSGQTALGPLSLEGGKVKSLKFNTEGINRGSKKPRAGTDSWPGSFNTMAEASLASGESVSLKHLAVVYRVSGCDTFWIPCKGICAKRRAKVVNL